MLKWRLSCRFTLAFCKAINGSLSPFLHRCNRVCYHRFCRSGELRLTCRFTLAFCMAINGSNWSRRCKSCLAAWKICVLEKPSQSEPCVDAQDDQQRV